jgi:hypothetical protein
MNQEKIKRLFRYEPDTGHLYWRKPHAGCNFGKPAGCMSRKYVVIRIDGVLYQASRLIWLYQVGKWPDEVDHKDGNPSNNTWDNLREADRNQQIMNANRAVGYTGIRGVTFDKARGKFKMQLNAYGRFIQKRFDTLDEAIAARKLAEQKFHGEFAVGER